MDATAAAAAGMIFDTVSNVVTFAFQAMGIAEEEIAAGKKRASKSRHTAIDAVFGSACPSPLLRGKSLELYRAHVRELVQRAEKGVGLSWPR